MIYITGDVHAFLNNWEQKKIGSEVRASLKYLQILHRYKLNATLFVNGICLMKEKENVDKLLKFDVELGGHTYNNFGSMNIFKSYVNRKYFGCIYGSDNFQKKDIKKTKEAFENVGLEMKSWRTHAYGSNDATFKFLNQNGVTHVSDLLGDTRPFRENGVIHVPINIPPDQNTIAYGLLNPENRDPFASCTKGRIKPEEWFEILKKRIEKNEKDNIVSILLLHPATMAYINNFKLFEKIAKFLSKYKSGKISEIKA
ncbi:MAG: polysaccharide deacetylase family protein [Nanoarchaeota archaeon]